MNNQLTTIETYTTSKLTYQDTQLSYQDATFISDDLELITKWLQIHPETGLKLGKSKSMSTIKTYIYNINHFFNFIGKGLNGLTPSHILKAEGNNKELKPIIFYANSIKDITTNDINDYQQFIVEKYKSNNSILNKIATVKSLLNYAKNKDYIPRIPLCDWISGKSVKALKPRNLEMTNVLNTVNQIVDFKEKMIFKLLIETGMRVTELINLKYSDFLVEGDNVIISIIGKGAKFRTNYISKNFFNQLLTLKNDFNDYLFIGYGKKNLSRVTIFRLIKKYFKNASPHYFRHLWAQYAKSKGMDIYDISLQLGHSNCIITETYLRKETTNSGLAFFDDLVA